MTIDQQWSVFLNQITTRKRNPAKGATLAAYKSYYFNWISPNLGKLELSQLENGEMKRFVSKLAEKNLAAATITAIVNCTKGIIGSAMDDNGNELYPRKWNNEFIDTPPIENQKAPIVTREELEMAILALQKPYDSLVIVLAATGLRIGECLSLKANKDNNSSYWSYNDSKLVITRQLWRGREQSTKTAAGSREVDIPNELNEYLKERFQEGLMFSIRLSTAYQKIKEAGIPGFHSLRRYRCTHLENSNVPRGLAMFWIGHAAKNVHETYLKMDKDIQARKEWCFKAGLGFTIYDSANQKQTLTPACAPAGHQKSESICGQDKLPSHP